MWQSGDRDAVRAAVPTEIGLRTNLIGPSSAILNRLRLDRLGLLIDLVREVNAESPDQSN